ncbi:hypothetical protein BFW38_03915 [Terasakiispira papahanaumokuakeensis]|uniref:GIY-YIG domain-containing protein n=1 Tax=Terasakiispira papahanaumokuakeensis TaxID=197479 RepID=A0A1E2V7D1_9GAMM|nr:GIY-YIG nuclease family protein [Terasakiispira papahanaumokuakeensis]ODC02823.1 hypothetical protein BFW38_03915 [Terasakiispira papahanaumokuakeensis]
MVDALSNNPEETKRSTAGQSVEGQSVEGQAVRWSLYIVQTAQGMLYTGISTDVDRRFKAHCDGKGARALRGKGPLQLIWQQTVASQRQALRLEYRIKRLPQKKKWALCQGQLTLSALIAHWQLAEEKNAGQVGKNLDQVSKCSESR